VELLLIRHAIAFERDPKRWRDDRERPLSPQGTSRARKEAAGLKQIIRRPSHVLTSPLLRTRETAAILTQIAGWPKALLCRQLLPGTAPEELLALLVSMRAKRIAAVGHEPDLGELLGTCLAGAETRGTFAFKKMGAALITFRESPRAGGGRLAWFVPPRVLRAAR
jgi:phosphohistidine phosphatase